ncbi:MAG: tyrosine--tRNA ligase [Bacteroidales bacterium]|jgi:tyrosyl-tRNA synthetase|nr:tyrosine--tRNA ligase [Bacteroidales bacterium]
MNFIDELRWRGMIHDMTPETEELFKKDEMVTGYVGIDPTADSLHIGHLVSIMMLKHLQLAGHKPLTLVGGATGMIGDPSGRSEERNLLSEEIIRHNEHCIKRQLEKLLEFGNKPNAAEMVNNYDWMKEFTFLGFIRDVGKHITVNYMMAKDSVKKRLETGISFTEFTYQLVQGYDFLYLNEHKNCKLQMGGSDQWGNITTGTELIRRKNGGDAYALTCPLITKADGGKFGKTETGNVWLDPVRTSPYKFYQFWLNTSDEDAEKYIRIFTLFTREEIDEMIARHKEAPHQRELQKALAKDLTVRVHSEADYQAAIDASAILFGAGTTETLKGLSEDLFLSVFEGVPQSEISKEKLGQGIPLLEFLADETGIFPSRGEARRTVKENALSINKMKVVEDKMVGVGDLLNEKYILVQKGKKNYFLVVSV